MIAYHFAPKDNRLGCGDGRAIVLGETLTVDASRISPCEYGLHASAHPLDALRYASGPLLYRVQLGGTIMPHGKPIDKYAASERTALAGGKDASPMLHAFARSCALDVIHLWDAPAVVREYLETGDETKRDAAWAAADAAWAAARAAARDAARAAADAAWAAADAAWAAARDAAWAAARDAARAARAAADAAWAGVDAARDAAWDAADAKQRERFESMVLAFLDGGAR
jgi:hypothetical protein